MKSRDQGKVSFPLLLTVLSWGFNFVALKLLFAQGMTPAAVSLVRFVLMWLVLAGLCLTQGRFPWYPKGEIWRYLSLGMMSMGIYMILFLEGMARTSPAEGAIILATSPIFTALLAVAFKQDQFSWAAIGGTVLAFLGVTMVILAGHHTGGGQLVGNLLVLASAGVWAFCAVMTRTLVQKDTPLNVLTLSMPGALPLLIPFGIGASLSTNWGQLDWVGWLMLAHIVILAGVVGFVGFYVGVRQVGSAGAMLYQFLVPPLAAFFAWLTLHDHLEVLQAVGLGVILAGVAWSTRARSRVDLARDAIPAEA